MNALLARMVATALTLAPALAAAEVEFREERIQLEEGAPATELLGAIQGDQIVDYRIEGRAGQVLSASFEPNNPSAYFNVLLPDSDTAIFIGSTSGNRFEGALPSDGSYTLRVYLMRNAARRNEAADYSLDVSLAAPPSVIVGFDETLELQGITFHVISEGEGSTRTLRIVPAGLEIDNTPIEHTIDGTVTGVEVADLNADGSPEIYVYVTSAGSGSHGKLVAYAANHRKSLSEIYLPPVAENSAAAVGYLGHDEFAVVENRLVQRFPVYREGDANADPTGGMRQVQYRLVPGEAGWLLQVDRIAEY
jgi:hypothetical protein